jgi:hypothetical protein
MRATKYYNNNGLVYCFNPVYRKWAFILPDGKQEFITHCKGGQETAHKVANILLGAIKRTKGVIDNMARKNIANLVN